MHNLWKLYSKLWLMDRQLKQGFNDNTKLYRQIVRDNSASKVLKFTKAHESWGRAFDSLGLARIEGSNPLTTRVTGNLTATLFKDTVKAKDLRRPCEDRYHFFLEEHWGMLGARLNHAKQIRVFGYNPEHQTPEFKLYWHPRHAEAKALLGTKDARGQTYGQRASYPMLRVLSQTSYFAI